MVISRTFFSPQYRENNALFLSRAASSVANRIIDLLVWRHGTFDPSNLTIANEMVHARLAAAQFYNLLRYFEMKENLFFSAVSFE